MNSATLQPVFDWFSSGLVILNELAQINPRFSLDMLGDPDGRTLIRNFLVAADISITDIEVVTDRLPAQGIHVDLATGQAEVRTEENEVPRLRFTHKTEQGQAVFGLADESGGTQNLLFLAGPVLDILGNGRTLVIDELDTSLHVLLVRELVRLFHRPEATQRGAQLIFSTHDTSLLGTPNLFRRDQIWFVEKDATQASHLSSLSDFSPRKNEAWERNYLAGRYGGVPFFDADAGLTR